MSKDNARPLPVHFMTTEGGSYIYYINFMGLETCFSQVFGSLH